MVMRMVRLIKTATLFNDGCASRVLGWWLSVAQQERRIEADKRHGRQLIPGSGRVFALIEVE